MKRSSTLYLRNVLLVFSALTLCFVFVFYEDAGIPLVVRDRIRASPQKFLVGNPAHNEKMGFDRLDLSEGECRETFPDLFADIEYAVKGRKTVLGKDNGNYKGLVQGRIKNNQLYIITTAPDTAAQIIDQRTAILSQLHRALITSPSRLAETPFAFVVNDNPKNNSWVFARSNKEDDYNVFVMPSFTFWSWPSATLGAFDSILSRIASVEKAVPWEKKIDKSVWRGTPWFNPLGHPRLRQDLLKASQHKEWAEVAALNQSSDNKLAIEDFCRYRYIVYTEGVTYSGRLPYHQACESVLVTAPLTYLTHTAWFMKPILASELLAGLGSGGGRDAARRISERRHGARLPPSLLPTVSDWRVANTIYVSPEFSNLEEVIMLLRAHPEIARRIARNQRKMVVEGGLLSGAAEACYWRALIKEWAGRIEAHEDWGSEEGERYETWLLKQVAAASGGRHAKPGG